MDEALNSILDHLKKRRGIDFFGYHTPMVHRRIELRRSATACKTISDYQTYLREIPEELDLLIDALTINVSCFFRDPLTFAYIAERLLPALIYHKNKTGDRSLRIWSNGCAMGEEPYSTAILMDELLDKESHSFDMQIFATDIDDIILKKAQKGYYAVESVEEITRKRMTTYFSTVGKGFQLKSKIKNQVVFSRYDILDKNSYAPPDSIFGGFDLILCRNVLLYFNNAYRNKVFNKFFRALTPGGFLILGETEVISSEFSSRFQKISDCCNIYKKKS